MSKIYCIVGGYPEDGFDLLVLPEGTDIEKEYLEYRKTTNFVENDKFVEWLKIKGAKEPSEEELTTFIVDPQYDKIIKKSR